MMKTFAALLCLVAAALPTDRTLAADAPAPAPAAARMQWWSDARFGMFIHWGLYSQWGCHYPGTNGQLLDGGSEHMMQRLKIPLAQYARIAEVFEPTNFNADAWVGLAKSAGMKYLVITAKHHDGFAMFDSPSSDYNIVRRTPWHRDPLRELADACARQGIRFGVYYSLGRDWADPDVPTKNGYRSNTWDFPDESKKVFARYFARKVKPQVTELLKQYHPAILWFDTPEKISAAESRELVDLIRQLDPDCIVNSRVGNGLGDYSVQEQKIPGRGDVRPWETCMTLNNHWGYFLGDEHWKSPATIIRNLVDIAGKGGNYLLNVGPTGDGTIPPGAVDDLKQIGAWMKINGESIYGTTAGPLKTEPAWGRVTQKDHTLYLHVFTWPKDGKLEVPLPDRRASTASLLARRDVTIPVRRAANGQGLELSLPAQAPDPIDSVVVLPLAP